MWSDRNSRSDVAAVLAYLYERGVPVVPRGGGSRIVGGAEASARSVVCTVGAMPRREVLKLRSRVFSGGHEGHPLVEFHRTRALRIECASGSEVQLDGELVGRLPAVFGVAPGALRVIGPATIG